MISCIVVSSLDVRREFMSKVKLFTAEAFQHLHIHLVLGFHVIFQTFVAGEGCRADRAVNLLSELFCDMFSHVSGQIAFEKSSKTAQVTENLNEIKKINKYFFS